MIGRTRGPRRRPSADTFSGMGIGDLPIGGFWPVPLVDPGAPHRFARGDGTAVELREVDPRHVGLLVVALMPIMVEPEGIEPTEGAEVARAFVDIAWRVVVMHILHR